MSLARQTTGSHRARSAVAGAFLLLVGFCAGACGTDAPVSKEKITIGFSAWPGWFPWQVAQERGMFTDRGLNVELRYYDNYTDSLKALATGEIDANSQTLNDTLGSVSAGSSQTIVLVNDNSTGNDKIIARAGITSVSDLRGKTVAVEQGTVDHYLLLLALQQSGLTDRDIQLIGMPTDAAAAAFAEGKVDAVGAFAPFTTTALQRPGSRAIATSAEFPGANPDHLVVSRGLVDGRPADVQALVNTWFEVLRWIRSHRDGAIAIMSKRAGVTVADYKTTAGTTLFASGTSTRSRPGPPPPLNYQAGQVADFHGRNLWNGQSATVPSRPLDCRWSVAAVPQE